MQSLTLLQMGAPSVEDAQMVLLVPKDKPGPILDSSNVVFVIFVFYICGILTESQGLAALRSMSLSGVLLARIVATAANF